jgi:hypothetical protein
MLGSVLGFLFSKPIQYFYILITSILSYRYLGPFFSSDVYIWIKSEMAEHPILSDLINIEGMLLDKFVLLLVPLCAVWSISFWVYHKNILSPQTFNRFRRVVSLFIGGAGFFISLLGAIILGVYVHFFLTEKTSLALAMSGYGLFVVFSGFYFKKISVPEFSENEERKLLI